MSTHSLPVVMFEDEAHSAIALDALHRLRSDLDMIDILDLKGDRAIDADRWTWTVRIAHDRRLSITWRTSPTILDDYTRIVGFNGGGTSYELQVHDGAPDGWKVLDWLETISLESIAMIKGPRTRDMPAIADAVAADHSSRHRSPRVHMILPSPWTSGAVDAEPGKGPPSSHHDPVTTSDMRLVPKGIGVHARLETGGGGRIHCSLSPVEREYAAFGAIAILRLAALLEAARKAS